jgi:hypothetical protein
MIGATKWIKPEAPKSARDSESRSGQNASTLRNDIDYG